MFLPPWRFHMVRLMGACCLSSRPAERHIIFVAHEVQRAQPVPTSPKDHAAFHASVALVCDCDTLRVYDHERESVLFFQYMYMFCFVLFCYFVQAGLD